MRARDSRFQSFIPVAQHQPGRRSPYPAMSPGMESAFYGFLIPEESDCVPSILELHAAWEAMFVDDVNIGDTAGRSASRKSPCPILGSAFLRLWFLSPSKTSWNRLPGLLQKVPVLPVCVWISRTPRHSVLRKMFAIYGSEAEVVPGRTSWLVMEVRPCAVRVAHRFHVQDLLRRFHTHFPAVPRSTSVHILSRLGVREAACNGLGERGKGGRGGTRACSTRSRYFGDVARSSSLSAATRLPFTHDRQKSRR
jgi:hypothetical protein